MSNYLNLTLLVGALAFASCSGEKATTVDDVTTGIEDTVTNGLEEAEATMLSEADAVAEAAADISDESSAEAAMKKLEASLDN